MVKSVTFHKHALPVSSDWDFPGNANNRGPKRLRLLLQELLAATTSMTTTMTAVHRHPLRRRVPRLQLPALALVATISSKLQQQQQERAFLFFMVLYSKRSSRHFATYFPPLLF
jgi:hypothetical protein